jgi:hypothetical protein
MDATMQVDPTPMRSKGSNTTKILILAALIVIGAGLWTYNWYSAKDRPVAKQFVGQVVENKDGILTVNGRYILEDTHPDGQHPVVQDQTVTIKLDGKTVYTKTKVFLPTMEEIEAQGGQYNGDDLRREKMAGTPDDLKKSTTITGVSSKNVYAKEAFTAREIQYVEPVYP